MNEHGSLVVMCGDATSSTCQRVVHSALRARTVELLPRSRDGVAQPLALLRAGAKAAIGRRTPHLLGCRAEDLLPVSERKSELTHRSAKPLEEQCAASHVLRQ